MSGVDRNDRDPVASRGVVLRGRARVRRVRRDAGRKRDANRSGPSDDHLGAGGHAERHHRVQETGERRRRGHLGVSDHVHVEQRRSHRHAKRGEVADHRQRPRGRQEVHVPGCRGNKVGVGVGSKPTAVIIPLPPPGKGLPDPPTQVHAHAEITAVRVSFRGVYISGGAHVTGYLAMCTSSDGGRRNRQQNSITPITVNHLSPGKTYTCVVASRNPAGFGRLLRAVERGCDTGRSHRSGRAHGHLGYRRRPAHHRRVQGAGERRRQANHELPRHVRLEQRRQHVVAEREQISDHGEEPGTAEVVHLSGVGEECARSGRVVGTVEGGRHAFELTRPRGVVPRRYPPDACLTLPTISSHSSRTVHRSVLSTRSTPTNQARWCGALPRAR